MSRFLNFGQAYEIFSLIKTYVDDHSPAGVVYSVSINGGDVIHPDDGGNVDLTIPTPELTDYIKKTDKLWLQTLYGKENWSFQQLIADGQADPLTTKSYVDAKIPDLSNIIKTVSVNGGTRVGPDSSGNADLLIQTYTLELDGGAEANITASIDGCAPVSKDADNNINLDIPDKYIDTISGWGRTFTNTNTPMYDNDGNAIPHTLNLGFIGKPRYYVDVTPSPAFISIQTPAYFYIQCPSDGMIELYGDDSEYLKISNAKVIDVKGNLYIFKPSVGNWADGYFIGCQKGMTLNILSLGSFTNVKICTEVSDMSTPIMETFNFNVWEKSLVVKGFTYSDIKRILIDDGIDLKWIYKPIIERPEIYDNNTNFPKMVFNVVGGDVQEDDGIKFTYINFVDDPNLNAGQWVFRNKYVGAMDGSDFVYRLPYYSDMMMPDGSWILLDFVLVSRNKTNDSRKYHCVVTDWNLNPLVDVEIRSFYSQANDYATTHEQHVYKRLRYNVAKHSFDIYDAPDF